MSRWNWPPGIGGQSDPESYMIHLIRTRSPSIASEWNSLRKTAKTAQKDSLEASLIAFFRSLGLSEEQLQPRKETMLLMVGHQIWHLLQDEEIRDWPTVAREINTRDGKVSQDNFMAFIRMVARFPSMLRRNNYEGRPQIRNMNPKRYEFVD